MSVMHLVCKPYSNNPHYYTLDLFWDDETGELSGVGADYIRNLATLGEVGAHPHGFVHTLSSEPLKNRTDMAAMIGVAHRAPDVLINDYPQFDYDDSPFIVTDGDGNVVDVGQVVY